MSGLSTAPGAPMPVTPYQDMLERLNNATHRLLDRMRDLENQLTPMLRVGRTVKNPLAEPSPEAPCAFLAEGEELLRRIIFLEESLDALRENLIL